MHYDITTEEASVQYLTGELSGSDRDQFEDEYFQDNEVFEKLLATEAELIDSCLEGEPSISGLSGTRFLLDAEQNDKVMFARALRHFVDAHWDDERSPHRVWPDLSSLWRRVLGLIPRPADSGACEYEFRGDVNTNSEVM